MTLTTRNQILRNSSQDPKRLRLRWWMVKVVCGSALIAALILKTIYVFPNYWISLTRISATTLAQSFCLIGFLVLFYHYKLLKQCSKNIGSPTTLLTDKGLYKWLRHPMYLADFIWFFGMFMLCANPLTLVILLIAYGALILHIKEEERYLANLFGDAFKQWQRKTKMLLPGLY